MKPWLWPLLVTGLLFAAIYKQGAESPLDTMLFAAAASLVLVLSLLDRANRNGLARLRDWKWAAVGLFAVWGVMILQLSPVPLLSGNSELWGRRHSVTVDPDLTVRAIVGMGSAAAFFVFGAVFAADRQRREIVLLLLSLMLVALMFQAFNSYFFLTALFELPEQSTSAPMAGTFLNANSFAIMMVLFFAGCIGVALAESKVNKGRERVWVQILAILLAIGAVGCIYLTMSRAAWMLTLVILVGLAWLLKPAYRVQIGVLGFSVLIAVLIVWSFAEQLGLSIQPLDSSQGLDGRFDDWQPGLDLTSKRPILGWGAGTFARAMEAVRESPAAASTLIVITPQNSILLITSETGLLGLAAWTVLSVGICLFVANGLRRRSASWALAAAFILGAAGAIVQSLFDFPMSVPAIAALWCFILGFCGGLGSASPKKRSSLSANDFQGQLTDVSRQGTFV
jgi:O-antigen ligase